VDVLNDACETYNQLCYQYVDECVRCGTAGQNDNGEDGKGED